VARAGLAGPKSPHYVELLGKLIDVEVNTGLVLEFTGDDASIAGEASSPNQQYYFRTLPTGTPVDHQALKI
jgi:hypothetical protein